jgi:hypothetical protein
MRSEREERAREFLHAQDLSRRLIAVMGVSSASPRPPSLAIGEKGRPNAFADDLKDTDDQENQLILRNGDGRRNKRGNGNCEKGDMPAGSCSPSRSGSTPKRSKVRKPANPSSVQPADQIKAMTGTQMAKATKSQHHQSKRSPLGELVSGNHNSSRATTQRKACHSPSSQPDRISVSDCLQESMDLEDFSFDSSEFSSSTPMHQDNLNQHIDRRDPSTPASQLPNSEGP